MKAYLRYYVELPFAAAQVDDAIGRLPREWLDGAAREASIRAELMTDSATGSGPRRQAFHLCVLLSPAQYEGGVIRRSLQWLAVDEEGWEPLLSGDLELAEMGPARVQLALSAQYRPLAVHLDSVARLASQRIGESTLKAFVDWLAGTVQTMLGEAPSSGGGTPGSWPSTRQVTPGRLRSNWAAS